ncbi:hypothetical protein BJF89_17785 [Corynebacterium sp. CNJ-954]|uniref:hypothetical protein n=1 Tax=Corynebacterium sp. CNJ-954 TaxID=1904962 RepID=UPI00095A0858|nr:hypothetical protein [Corynebacterium sp. CNJ-954]OLT52296.1 hypothetical protein BJF89_17785 [Corynebacterium sp. CNJ-954]
MTTDLSALVHEAGHYGITLTVTADDRTGSTEYVVTGPGPTSPRKHTSNTDAAEDMQNRITSVADAAEAAHQRAEQWAEARRTAADDTTAWATLAAEVNNLLPDGCTIPTPTANDLYGVSSWPPMTAMVADALATHHARNRDRTARKHLADALAVEGSTVTDSTEQVTLRPDHWDTIVSLYRPLQIVPNPGTHPEVRNGRVLVDTDTRRVIAWRHYGVVVPVGREVVDAAVDQLDAARRVVTEVAEKHRAEGDRLAEKLRL